VFILTLVLTLVSLFVFYFIFLNMCHVAQKSDESEIVVSRIDELLPIYPHACFAN
jgi:CHASE3 domain sensor protein